MIQDYAKKTIKKAPPKRGLLLVTFVVSFAILAPLFFFIMHFYKIKQLNTSIKKAQIIKTTEIKKPSTEFDFYTLLPTIEVPNSNNIPAPSYKNEPNEKTPYLLQIASFDTLSQAKNLITQVEKLGFRTFIQRHESGNQSWFRIMTGPYPSWESAELAQKSLQDQHIESILVKIKKAPS